MAIVNSIQNTMNGFGTGPGPGIGASGYAVGNTVALSGASTTTTVTLGTQGYTNGKIRVKVYNGGSSSTAAAVTVTVSDGTNTYAVGNFGAYTIATGANSGFDKSFDVLVDIEIATVTFVTLLTVGTTTASFDYEICLNP
jgi:hypothetical protein